jgi:AsmA protein
MLTVRALKFVAVMLGGLVALLAVVLFAARLLINPNDYKERIARAVKESTGRELALPGDIQLSVFPWVALELGPASLGNRAGFGDEPFVAVRHAAVRVKLLPLLRKQLQIGRVDIDGLDLRMQRNAAGQGNWQELGAPTPPGAPARRAGPEVLRELAGLTIRNSRVSYQDLVFEKVNLEVGHVMPVAGGQYRIAGLKLEGTSGNGALPWTLAAPELTVDVAGQSLRAGQFSAQFGAARISGSIAGSSLLEKPLVTASFSLAPVSPRELCAQLGITLPRTRDPKALSSLGAAGDLAYGGNALRASKLDIHLDDSALRGTAAVTDLDARKLAFDLALDRIDLDRYRGPVQAAPAPVPAQLPSGALRTPDMNGSLTVGSAVVAGINLTQLHVDVGANGGVTHIAPATARLYGGNYAGDITLDDRGAVPAMSLRQSMTGVDVAALASDFLKSRRLSGRGTITSNLTTRGGTRDELLRSLNGRAAVSIDEGAIEGIDLWFEVDRAVSVIQKQSLPSSQGSGRTKFDTFKGSADVVNGILSSHDLNIASQNLRVTGQGTANLATQAIALQVKATLYKGAAGAAAGTLADIPLAITGTLTSPAVRPDLEALARAGVQQQIEKHKQELQQQLQSQLKDFLKPK